MSALLRPELEPEAVEEGWLAEPERTGVTSGQVLDALAARHPMDGWNARPGRWVFVREVCAQTGNGGDTVTTDVDLRGMALSPRVRGPLCSVGRVLSDESRPLLAESLRDLLGSEAQSEVARRLRAAGVFVAATTISRHQRGDCSCARRGVA